MPGPSDLIGSLQDEDDPFESAEEFKKKAQREVNRAASENLSPSQREQLDIAFNTDGGEEGQLLMKQYDLLDNRDQYRFEQFAGRDGVDVVSTNMEWTDGNKRLVYFVMYHVQPSLYDRVRRREIEDPDLHAVPPDPDESGDQSGVFERIGRGIDGWIAAVAAFFVSVFYESVAQE